MDRYEGKFTALRNTGSRAAAWTITSIILLLGAVRAVLPTTIQWYVNRQIDSSSEYEGSIGDVDLHLVRGAYSVQDITISKISGDVPVPLFAARQVDFSLIWSALVKGSVVSEVYFDGADINIVDGSSEGADQTGKNADWMALLGELAPFQIGRMAVQDSALHFHNFEAEEPVDVSLTQFNAIAENISNSRELASDMTATIQASGLLAGSGNTEFRASFNPDREYLTFDLDGRISNLSVTALDNLIREYAPFDVEGGTLTLTTELTATDGEINGYFKPLLTGIDVFEWKEDVIKDKDNPLQLVWEALVGLSSELLENQSRDQLATIIPVSGRLDEPDTDKIAAFFNILRNAFIEAFNAGFEDTITLDGNEPTPDTPLQEIENQD